MRSIYVLMTVCALSTCALNAQAKVGGFEESVGNKYVSADVGTGASVAKWPGRVDVCENGYHRVTLFGHSRECGSFDFATNSVNGGSLMVKHLGKTVFAKDLNKPGGDIDIPLLVKNVFDVKPVEIFNVGIFDVSVGANAGFGTTANGAWDIANYKCDVQSAIKQYAFADGLLEVKLLGGIAKLSFDAGVNLLNRTATQDIEGTRHGIDGAHASFSRLAWELYIKVKVKVDLFLFDFDVYKKTIVNKTGDQLDVTFF